jgi:TRAP transporter T-component
MKLALALTLLTGCASFIDNKAASSTLKILEKSQQAAARLGDVQLAREALPGGILQLEAFALAYPDHTRFRVMHADAVCNYAVAFVFDDWEDASLANRAQDATRIAARLDGLLATCVSANKALPASTRRDLWLAMVGAVRLAVAPLANVSRLADIKAALAAVATKQPGFSNADAELLLGTLEAATHRLFGGADGTARFTAARTSTQGKVLNVDVMHARAVAVANKDRDLFVSTLERVIATDITKWPEHRLANELAKQKARRYLESIDTLIPPVVGKRK